MCVGEEEQVHFYEESEARRARRHAGLYHYALLFHPVNSWRWRRLRGSVFGTPRYTNQEPPKALSKIWHEASWGCVLLQHLRQVRGTRTLEGFEVSLVRQR
jgi:hypothetical protein